ncbi:MAG TPA: 2-oxoglutarate dehydrogenase E1 component [Deltaproteobacteria bacterium]|nr:2-oxoglutarate dehydrogenase E1 component [Candidatus Lambdaproteobacteria bacterium]HIN48394.1 2-oxoglutarate dehydrogenase E1 component [Deltaproteobacteria bacterium]
MNPLSYLNNADIGAFEGLYQQYQQDPKSVDPEWRNFFEGFEFSKEDYTQVSANKTDAGLPENFVPEQFQKELAVSNLIGAYRQRGHMFAKTNPVRPRRKHDGPIDLENFGLSIADLDTEFHVGSRIGLGTATLREIYELLEQTYCGSIGVEYKFVRTLEIITWLEQKMESCRNTPNFSREEKIELLRKTNEAVAFESFLHTKFVGQKRFSLEGGESIIPALDTVVEYGAELGVEEFVIGMAHRGRLNVLANVLGKTYNDIFAEFEGKAFGSDGFAGDVKYHMGYSSDKKVRSGKSVHLSLTPNPSHLEAVNPVVEGISRAKIDQYHDGNVKKLVPILIHGDHSLAGQGIVYEVLQMSQLPGYGTGGTVHLVINNQVGFTADYVEGRSSTYCTDVAKTTLSPVFHVNADDIEAVVYVIKLALEFRQKFHRDVFVDILGYRRHGHNEADEPRFTQPDLYRHIARHPQVREVYSKKLVESGSLTEKETTEMEEEFKQYLNDRLEKANQQETASVTSFLQGVWSGVRRAKDKDFEQSPVTGVPQNKFFEISQLVTDLSRNGSADSNLKFFAKIKKLYQNRRKMVAEDKKLDWGMAETMAFAVLVTNGTPVRLSGQDSGRGTFAHRHAIITAEDNTKHIPLNHISDGQAPFEVYNSFLSEYGVLGFEYGYAYAAPTSLTIWEAQFGDFANGAQIVIDQFVASSETKWHRMNGVVLMLPHGHEGQGPEHSSARIERFLILCAKNNMQIINCTTPANIFHILLRQMAYPFRKPLVIFTPKSLLRHPKCMSPLEDFLEGTRFREVIDDDFVEATSVRKVLFCSGKVYYDLLERQQKNTVRDVAIVRLEQLYPFPEKQLLSILKRYQNAKKWCWVQEEPENMGAWGFVLRIFSKTGNGLELVAREADSSPAVGSPKLHAKQQENLVRRAFEV